MLADIQVQVGHDTSLSQYILHAVALHVVISSASSNHNQHEMLPMIAAGPQKVTINCHNKTVYMSQIRQA